MEKCAQSTHPRVFQSAGARVSRNSGGRRDVRVEREREGVV